MPFSIRPFRCFSVQRAVTYNAGTLLKLPPAYFSGFWLLILLLSSGSAYAEWVAVSSSEDMAGITAYLDPATIRRSGDVVKLWDLIDFKTLQTAPSGSFLSIKTLGEYDCAGKRTRKLAQTAFSGNMLNGKVIYTDSRETTWTRVEPGTVGQNFWKLACGKQ